MLPNCKKRGERKKDDETKIKKISPPLTYSQEKVEWRQREEERAEEAAPTH